MNFQHPAQHQSLVSKNAFMVSPYMPSSSRVQVTSNPILLSNQSSFSFVANVSPLPKPNRYLETRANNHVIPDISALSLHSPYTGPVEVAVGNMQTLLVKHTSIGILPTLAHNFKLNKILHVPLLSMNLLSVQQLASDNNCSITFDSNSFYIQDKITKWVI